MRDQAGISDLVQAVLAPLTAARGDAEPLLGTLHSYFETGGVATETARRYTASVRTITHRWPRSANSPDGVRRSPATGWRCK